MCSINLLLFQRDNLKRATKKENENYTFIRNDYRKKTFPKGEHNNFNIIIYMYTKPETKRFGSLNFPQGTNFKNELMVYELNSLLLKSEKIDHYIYNKLQGNFVNIIKTHKGSRIFQNYLKNTQSDILHQIFQELSPLLSDILMDPYANYFCKRFSLF